MAELLEVKMKTILSVFLFVISFSAPALAYTTYNQTSYTVTSSSITGVYQVIQGTYVFTDSITASSAPAVSFTPRITLDGSNGNASVYGVILSTTQTNYQIGITTPSIKGVVFWDNGKGEMCISTGTTNCYSYGKFTLTTP